MPDPVKPPTLGPDVAVKFAEFARSCKAAARAVALYPGSHPAIATSLSRLSQATSRLTAGGPFTLQVRADALLLDGALAPRPDPAVAELAEVLYRHVIGALTVNAAADAESWRTLLLLLARAPEEVRADGGIAQLWHTAGGPSLEIVEIDYAEVLREKQGQAATIDQILEAALGGPQLLLDDTAMRMLVDIVGDPVKLDELMAQLENKTSGQGVDIKTAAFLSVLRGLAEYVARTTPEKLEGIFKQMGQAAGRLSADDMVALLEQRNHPEAMVGTIDVVGAVADRMSDASVAQFVAGSVVAERGATDRLAHAFQALVPERDRQRQLLALAETEVAASELGQDQSFSELWGNVEGMLTSYSDASFVSTEYGRELSNARDRAVTVEGTSDDPPERVAAWLTTVSDGALRGLDHHLLLDLLVIEVDPLRWRDIAQTVVTSRRRSRPGRLLRSGLAPRPGHRRSGGRPCRAAAPRARRAGAVRARIDDEARDRVPPQHRRRGVRAVQGAVPRDGDRGDHAARRGAVERTGREVAPAPPRHPDRIRRVGTRVGAAADELAQLGGAADRRVPVARVRRDRRPEGADPPPHRHGASGPA